MPEEEKDKYATGKILRKAKKRRKKFAKQTTGEQSEKLKAGVGRRDYALNVKGKDKTKSFHIGGEKTEKVKDKPVAKEPELEHKKTGEKRAGEVETVFKGKEKDYDTKKYPGRLTQAQKKDQKPGVMTKTATAEDEGKKVRITSKMKYSDKKTPLKKGEGFEPQERVSGKIAGQEFRKGGAKPTRANLASIAGFKDPDVLTKTKRTGKGLEATKGKSKYVAKKKTFSHVKPSKQEVRAGEIKAKQAREKELQEKFKKKGKDTQIQSTGGSGRSKIKYKESDTRPSGKPSSYYTEVTEKFKGKGRKMKTVVKKKRKKYKGRDMY